MMGRFDNVDILDYEVEPQVLSPPLDEYDLEDCSGDGCCEGIVEEGPLCMTFDRQCSDGMCGGCYRDETCPECNGFGMVQSRCKDCYEFIKDGVCIDTDCLKKKE